MHRIQTLRFNPDCSFTCNRRTAKIAFILCIGIGLLSIAGCTGKKSGPSSATLDLAAETREVVLKNEPIRPLSAPQHLSREKVMLGKSLFHDVRLSKDNSLSCASCHSIADGGDDGLKTAVGIGGQTGPLNSPTVLNSSLSVAQFWDGRAKNLHEQIPGPIHHPMEMGSKWDEVLVKLRKDRRLVIQFEKLYDSGLCSQTICDAIATYECGLITVNSPFDQYLFGVENAISSQAIKGYELFKSIGCISCHQGKAVGGNMFQEFGIVNDFSNRFKDSRDTNKGRFNVTNREVDLHRFKVPGLRNISQTAPYFHDGSAETLEEAINVMAEYQLGESLSNEEIAQIKSFLETLTGELPKELL